MELAQRVLKAVASYSRRHPASSATFRDVELAGAAPTSSAIELNTHIETSKADRMQLLVRTLGAFVDDGLIERGEGEQTVWDALHSLPRELLDPWQKLMHLKITSPLRKENAPQIDFLTTKLLFLTGLLDDARSKAMADYGSSSAAFVTFRDARTARLAAKILPVHPRRSLACNTAPAPDWTDILWPRLEKSVYKSSFVRGWVVFLAVWAFTLAWIFPVSVLCGLASFTSIAGFLPAVANFLRDHPKVAGLISSLAPVILVALLTISICPILLLIANKAETINTRLGVHNSVLERFWKFCEWGLLFIVLKLTPLVMVNGVVFFAVRPSILRCIPDSDIADRTGCDSLLFDSLPDPRFRSPTHCGIVICKAWNRSNYKLTVIAASRPLFRFIHPIASGHPTVFRDLSLRPTHHRLCFWYPCVQNSAPETRKDGVVSFAGLKKTDKAKRTARLSVTFPNCLISCSSEQSCTCSCC